MTSDENLSRAEAWRAHELSQLKYFRSLSLREKMEAVEGMADIVRCFERMRTEGRFGATSERPRPRSLKCP
jgi:hypothetical protein